MCPQSDFDKLVKQYAQQRQRAEEKFDAGEIPCRDCELCGEPADEEMGEFIMQGGGHVPENMSIFAHASCASEQGLEVA